MCNDFRAVLSPYFYNLYIKIGIHAGTDVPVLAHYGGCMAVVWRLYGGSLAEVAHITY
jgi:hypothetical protein